MFEDWIRTEKGSTFFFLIGNKCSVKAVSDKREFTAVSEPCNIVTKYAHGAGCS